MSQQQQMMLHEQTMSGQMMPSQMMSPQQHMMLPQQQMTHQQLMSPQQQMMSHQMMSPQEQMMLPQQQIMSPQMFSPQVNLAFLFHWLYVPLVCSTWLSQKGNSGFQPDSHCKLHSEWHSYSRSLYQLTCSFYNKYCFLVKNRILLCSFGASLIEMYPPYVIHKTFSCRSYFS